MKFLPESGKNCELVINIKVDLVFFWKYWFKVPFLSLHIELVIKTQHQGFILIKKYFACYY